MSEEENDQDKPKRRWFKRFMSMVGVNPKERDLVKEMEELIEESSAEGVINSGEGEMLKSVLSFRRTLVREVMVPRPDITAIEAGDPLAELVKLMVEEGHSRIPVYDDTIDHIVGIVHARDLLPWWEKRDALPSIGEIMRQPYFVPETMQIETLLAEMRRRKTHLAFAVDEYGGVSGIVTLEDLLEEIVGEIQDEYDEEEDLIRRTPEGWEVNGRCEIEALEEVLGKRINIDADFETVGGLVFSALGKIPRVGETFVFDGLKIKVKDADPRRVKSVLIEEVTE